jgi:murein DD-endopeptidase MepM/ murein hydrolase activator NlpD
MNTEMIFRLLSKLRYAQLYNPAYLKAAYPVLAYPLDMKIAYITQIFGVNASSYYPMKGHDGIDLGAPVGTLGRGPSRQKVLDLILQKNSYGRHIITQDDLGHKYIYGHLHEFLCNKGDTIEKGQAFFSTGGDIADPYHGFSTGPHLHWEWRPVWASLFNGYGGAENQLPYVSDDLVSLPPPPAIFSAIVDNPNNPSLGLYVRTQKGKGPYTRQLDPNEKVDIYAINGIGSGAVSGQIDPFADAWIALISGGKPYVKMIRKE